MHTSKSLDLRLIRAVIVSLFAGSLTLPSASVLAAPPPSASPTEASDTGDPDPAVALSRSLFEQGLDAYEADDYAGAVQYWIEAHGLMAQTPELSGGRRVLGFDLAQAQMRAYARDHDESRVTAAKPLLEKFVAWVDRPGHTMDEGEKQDRMRALELLERIASESPPPVPELIRPAPTPAQAPPPIAPTPSGAGLLIGGGLALGASVGSVIAAFAMTASGRAAERRYNSGEETNDFPEIEAAERDGRRANIGFVTSATSALLLGAAGVTMLVIGARRHKRHVSASAALTPSSASAAMSVRF